MAEVEAAGVPKGPSRKEKIFSAIAAANPNFAGGYALGKALKGRITGGSTPDVGESQPVPDTENPENLPESRKMRKGGRIKKTGVYMMHKGEIVIPERIAKRLKARGKGRKSGRS